MAIVAIVGAMALGGISTVLEQQEIARERADRWREIQFAMRILVQDLSQIHPRPTRDETGRSSQPSLLAGPSEQFAVEFSRGGWSNPARFPRGTVLRVAYVWEDEVLVRFHWPVADRTLSTPPVRTELLQGVSNVEFRFIDSSGQADLEWPPVGADGENRLIMRPRAVEVVFELADYGRIWRLVEVAS
jgi:general secretion pathway protein J